MPKTAMEDADSSPRILAARPHDPPAQDPSSLALVLAIDPPSLTPPTADAAALTDAAQHLAALLSCVRRRLADLGGPGPSRDPTPTAGAQQESRWQLVEDVELLRAEVEAQYAAAGAQKASLKAATVELQGLRCDCGCGDGTHARAAYEALGWVCTLLCVRLGTASPAATGRRCR